MPRDYKTCLEDISEAIGKAGRYAAGHTRETLVADEKTLDAVLRNLEVIGEAAKNIPAEVRVSYPEVEWKRLAGLRNKLPTLAIQITRILASMDSQPPDTSEH